VQYKDSDTTPHGHTNFNHHPTNLHVSSTSYETAWLQIADDPTGGKNAEWRGMGKLNGVPGFCFQVNVHDDGQDNAAQGTEMDKFRIKIWQPSTAGDCSTQVSGAPIYDNDSTATLAFQFGTVLGGGNIVVHQKQ
jgi:hypothetical protein